MIRSRIGRVVRVIIPLVLLVIVSSVVSLSAQGSPTLNQVVAKLDAIIGMLTPTPPVPAGPVTLTTPVMFATGQEQVACLAANVGTENKAVVIQIIGFNGDLLAGPTTVDVAPSKSGVRLYGGGLVALRCEFTFTGSASSVRANLLVENSDGGTAASADAR